MLQWDRCNSVVLSWILNSISEDLFSGQVFSNSAHDVWEELKETYDKVDGSVTFNLHQKINSLTQNGSSISDYYHKLNSFWKQFDALVKLPTCTCHASKEFKEHNDLIKLMQFLMGLDNSYESIRSNILSRDPLPSIKSAFAIISREESHRGSSFVPSSSKSQSSTFLVSRNFDNKKFFGKGPNPNLKCTKCNKLGHTIDRCYEIVGYPSGWVKRDNNNGKSVQSHSVVSDGQWKLSNDQMAKLMSLISDKAGSGSMQSNMAGAFLNLNELFNSNFPISLILILLLVIIMGIWVGLWTLVPPSI